MSIKDASKKRPTIRDVAKVADVSVATVSRFLNGKTQKMSDQTAERIRVAIKKMNYVPNSAAREMARNSSRIIAVLAANIADYFSVEIYRGVSSRVEEAGYISVLLNSGSSLTHERQLLHSINQHGFDGLIFQPLTSDTEQVASELTRDFPVVVVDRDLPRSAWPKVVTDNYEAARSTTEYFADQGFQRVVVLTSTIELASTRIQRFQGISQAASTIETIEIDENNFQPDAVYGALKKALSRPGKCLLFALKERWLLEFLPRLMKEHVIDEKKTAVTGFADTALIGSICPYAKVVSQNPFLMGQRAGEILLQMLKGEKNIPEESVIKAQFKH